MFTPPKTDLEPENASWEKEKPVFSPPVLVPKKKLRAIFQVTKLRVKLEELQRQSRGSWGEIHWKPGGIFLGFWEWLFCVCVCVLYM